MGKLFTIDPATRSVITDALDDIITEFGKDCRLVYPPRWVPCANCVNDPVGKKSANRWKTGGPIRFQAGGICPSCNGSGGFSANEEFEVLQLKVEWNVGKFWLPVPGAKLRTPHSVCQTKGYLSDLPKIVQADHLVLQLPIEGLLLAKFVLSGTPTSPGNIIQDRYFVATWESK